MRNKEQFKAYVYEKADTARARNKRMHAVWARGAVAFSLLVVVGGVYMFANSGMNDSLAPTLEKANVHADESILRTETGAVADVYDYSMLTEAASIEDSNTIVVETAASAKCMNSLDAVVVETYAQSHTYSAVPTLGSLQTEYTIFETASQYNGDLTNIDFSKNVALMITVQMSIESWKIIYNEDSIVIVLASGDRSDSEITYTILLEKAKYTGQEIEFYYK